MAEYVYTFLQLSKYATELVDTEAKKVKRFLLGSNPEYKTIVLAGRRPTTLDGAVDRAYIAEEVQREKEAGAAIAKKDSEGNKKGGRPRHKRQRRRSNPSDEKSERRENKPVCDTCGKTHRTELCWRTTGACSVCSSMEHKMAYCPKARRDVKAPYQQPAQNQAALPAPPQRLALPAPPS